MREEGMGWRSGGEVMERESCEGSEENKGRTDNK